MKHKSSQQVGKAFLYLPYKLLVLLFCLSTLACNRESGVDPIADETNSDVIQLGASVNLQTRATEAGFEQNDSIGLYLVKWQDATTPGSLVNAGNYADNALFQLSALPNSWTTPQTLYYPADGGKLDFYAYYPYRAPAFGSGTVLNLAVAPDQSVYHNYTRSDFMLARTLGVKRSTAKVHLDFYHRLSQIVFELKPGVGFTANDLKIAKVKIVNAITDGTFNLADTVVTTGTTRQDITPCGSWEQKDSVLTGVMAILMPQYINTTTYIEVTVGNRKFSFKPSPAIHLNQTCSRVFTITVNNTGIDVETQIHPWNICPPVQGNATEEEEEVIVRMTTKQTEVMFAIKNNSDITVDWGDGTTKINGLNHTYNDGKASHEIVFRGSKTALTFLNCDGNKLTSLEVSKNTALTELHCFTNLLTSLDVSRNMALTHLNCSTNQLADLDVSKNMALTQLSCYDNQLTNLDISKNIALKELECGENQLTSLEISKNIGLTVLSCNDNLLTSLEVSKNMALTNLNCSTNQLTNLDISKNTALIRLDCSVNPLRNLDISMNTALTNLDCAANLLTSLDISKNTALTILSCCVNQLTSLEISKHTALTVLSCYNNQLTNLDVSKNTLLTDLYCHTNPLINLDVSKNTALKRLWCHTNQLTDLDVSMNTELISLRCSNNPFISDVTKMTTIANSLPDWTGKDNGTLEIGNLTTQASIQSICDAKNWKFESLSQSN